MICTLGAPAHAALVAGALSRLHRRAGAPGVITFEELCAFALARLPERLRRMGVAAADVGDVVHDVVIVAYPKLGRFEPRRLGREGEREVDVHRSLLAWLVEIARRLVMRQRTRARSRLEVCVGDVADRGGADTGALTPEEMVARGERWALAVGVLGELRPERAEVLLLHEVGELPVREIAGRLKVKPNTVKSRLARARQDARAVIQRMGRSPSPSRRSLVAHEEDDGKFDANQFTGRGTGSDAATPGSRRLVGGEGERDQPRLSVMPINPPPSANRKYATCSTV